MTYWIGLLGLFIGLFSPAAGVLFLIPVVGKHFMADWQLCNKFFVGWLAVCAVLFLINFIDHIQVLNLTFGAGLSFLLLFHMMRQGHALNLIFMSLLLLNSGFIVLRQWLFSDFIFTQYTDSVDMTVNMLSSRLQEGSEQYLLFLEMIDMSKDFYLKYSPGIWIFTMMLCLMIGYHILCRNSKSDVLSPIDSDDLPLPKEDTLESLRHYQTHLYVIYSLIIALMIAVFWVENRVYAVNYLFALTPLFLIQGLAVLNFKIGKWFKSSKFLLFIAILSLVLNPYIVLFISVIGLFDNWFDFRNLSKPEDLNENHTNGNA